MSAAVPAIPANAPEPTAEAGPNRMSRALVRLLPIDAAGISIRLGTDVSMPIGCSEPEAATAEKLQFSLGEGPCVTCGLSGERVLVPDLDRPEARAIWPVYAIELLTHSPYRAVFSFPLPFGGQVMGTANLYRRTPGPMGPDAVSRMDRLSGWLTDMLRESDLFTEPDPDGMPWLHGNGGSRQAVWLAQGMTMQANLISARQALTLMRAQAFSEDRLLDDIAEDMVQGRADLPRIVI